MTQKVKNNLKKFLKGFTLVELIIVIAIVSILLVSAFMVLTKWIGESRDSRRLSDIETIKKSLTVNYVDPTTSENYPKPDNSQTVTGDSGEKLWHQGHYGNKAAKNTASINKAPKDPSGSGYGYSITTDQETFEVYAKLENGDNISYITNKVYAEDNKYIAKNGNYDGYIVGTTGDKYNLYNTPSLYILSGAKLISGSYNYVYQEGQSVKNQIVITGVDVSTLYSDTAKDSEKQTTLTKLSSSYPEIEDGAQAKSAVKNADNNPGGVDIDLILEGECKDGLCLFNLSDSNNTSTGKKLMTYQPRTVGKTVPTESWGCDGNSISTNNTDGKSNTNNIISNSCGTAAQYCNQLSITVNGITYDDWYLPAKYELDAMCERDNFSDNDCGQEGLNDMDIGGKIGSSRVWSSTESSTHNAMVLFSSGSWDNRYKGHSYAVQCVRLAGQ